MTPKKRIIASFSGKVKDMPVFKEVVIDLTIK